MNNLEQTKRRRRMGLRNWIIEYSRGINLDHFWKLYFKRQKTGPGLKQDWLNFRIASIAKRHGGYIGPDTRIEGRPELPHGLHGIFISRYAVIEKGCRLYQNVTIGEVNGKAPYIEEGVFIGAGAILVGDIRIGAHAKIGAGAVISEDIPAGATAVSLKPRIIPAKNR